MDNLLPPANMNCLTFLHVQQQKKKEMRYPHLLRNKYGPFASDPNWVSILGGLSDLFPTLPNLLRKMTDRF